MLHAFLYAVKQYLYLFYWPVKYLWSAGWRHVPKRCILFGTGVPLFLVFQLTHWFFFLLDELLFPGYRQVKIKQPVFIVGIPRSGTTFLYRTLARDRRFTVTQTWECLFAPSITQRYIFKFAARIFQPLFKPRNKQKRVFFKKMADIHKLGPTEPEEDFLFFLPLISCFILIIFFPHVRKIWDLAYFDKMPAQKRQLLMAFYGRCVQKHLYFHGTGYRYLSKNPSFTPFVKSLNEKFPHALFVGCTRTPLEAVPSQFSSLEPALKLTGPVGVPGFFQTRLIDVMHFYYSQFNVFFNAGNHKCLTVEMQNLRAKLYQTIERIYHLAGLQMRQEFRLYIKELSRKNKSYKSRHNYALEKYHLDIDVIEQKFADVWPVSRYSEKTGYKNKEMPCPFPEIAST